jgi:RimJ/RimL family protein N-acetyltransferase
MKILCGSCIIRSFTMDDVRTLPTHANDRDIWLNLRDRFPHPYTEGHARAYLEFLEVNPDHMTYAIEVDGEAAGSISLMPNHDVERVSVETGYWLGRRFWGRGIMTDAVRAMTDHAFANLEITRVYALPFAHNAASVRVLEKAGFTREGYLKRSVIKDGVVRDQHLFAKYTPDAA